jgi:hypothetical protein
MTERDPDFVLDGNAAAGPLQEIFVPEITAAQIQCTGRGATRAVGALCLYAALVLRCTVCDEVLPRTAHTPHGRWLEMIAARYLIFLIAGDATWHPCRSSCIATDDYAA